MPFDCPSGSCAWESYKSLGICNSCVDVTTATNATRVCEDGEHAPWNETKIQNCTCQYETPSEYRISGGAVNWYFTASRYYRHSSWTLEPTSTELQYQSYFGRKWNSRLLQTPLHYTLSDNFSGQHRRIRSYTPSSHFLEQCMRLSHIRTCTTSASKLAARSPKAALSYTLKPLRPAQSPHLPTRAFSWLLGEVDPPSLGGALT
jgi:hypothetical protein